jgi:alanyl-tRNA synthetase
MIFTHKKIRKTFINFFLSKQYKLLPGASIIPTNDKTLLFVNSGMVQFKNIFLEQVHSTYSKAITIQKCLRVGGKHNDFENIGYTSNHHTFFEMIGNFVFRNASKMSICKHILEFLINYLKLRKNAIYISIFKGSKDILKDDSTKNIWLNQLHIFKDNVMEKDISENFWSMGDLGPCGRCTEIFYKVKQNNSLLLIEIWNIVFMEFDQKNNGKLQNLSSLYIDTGCGMERLLAVTNNKSDNYLTDIFLNLLSFIEKSTNLKYNVDNIEDDIAIRILLDHSRAIIFLTLENIVPSNTGRGYILRKFIRRIFRYTKLITNNDSLLERLCKLWIIEIEGSSENILKYVNIINNILKTEKKSFLSMLSKGESILMKMINKDIITEKSKFLDGKKVFSLYETYGFHPQWIKSILEKYNVKTNWDIFENSLKYHKEKSHTSKFNAKKMNNLKVSQNKTIFSENYNIPLKNISIITIYNEQFISHKHLLEGKTGFVVLDKTSFYAESGGQIFDTGYIITDTSKSKVLSVRKINHVYIHKVIVFNGILNQDDECKLFIDIDKRKSISKNHSMTHLLNAALKNVLGIHVSQKGSMITEERSRFDFSHFKNISNDQIYKIEDILNNVISKNLEIEKIYTTIVNAHKMKAVGLIDKHYDENVSLIKIGDISLELCGGTHVNRTGDIGLVKIISEKPVSVGTRRIELLTSNYALNFIQRSEKTLHKYFDSSKISGHKILNNIKNLIDENNQLNFQIGKVKKVILNQDIKKIQDSSIYIKNLHIYPYIINEIYTHKDIKYFINKIKQFSNNVLILFFVIDQQMNYNINIVTNNKNNNLNLIDISDYLKVCFKLKGGGSRSSAQIGVISKKDVSIYLLKTQEYITEYMYKKSKFMENSIVQL